MTVLELMEELTEIGATVTSDGDQVAVCFPEERRFEVEALGPEIRRLKPELLKTVAERDVGVNSAAPGWAPAGLRPRPVGHDDSRSRGMPTLTPGCQACQVRPKMPTGGRVCVFGCD